MMSDMEFFRRLALFSTNIYNQLGKSQSNQSQNIVFSPFSIHTCAAMARLGAENETAEEMDRGLGFTSNGNVEEIADNYFNILASYENSKLLHIANKIYVMKGYSVRNDFNDLLKMKFYSSAEEINFAQSESAAATINNWVESKTNSLIRDLVSPMALDSLTRLVLLNAIHFKGEWIHQFNKNATRPEDFYLDETTSVKVPMMNVKAKFRYGNLTKLDAQVLEMPYKDSDLSMLVILPNSRTGLKQLEEHLKTVPMNEITDKLFLTEVIVKLPKFKTEYSIELKEAFYQLGMKRMFSDAADFGKMLNSHEPLKVSKIIHKAFIDVNEEGTEAAAATAMGMCFGSAPSRVLPPRMFIADKPFNFVIKNSKNIVLFAGNYVKN